MLYFTTSIFGAPIWGPLDRYFDMKNRMLLQNYVKNALSGDPESSGPQIRPQIGIRKVDPHYFSFKKDYEYIFITILASKC